MTAFPYTQNWTAKEIINAMAGLGFTILHQPAQSVKLRGQKTVHHREEQYSFHVEPPATSTLGIGPLVTIYNPDNAGSGLRSAPGATFHPLQKNFLPLIDPATYPTPRCTHHYFLDQFAALLEDAGYQRSAVAHTIAIWVAVCSIMMVNSANPQPYLLHRLHRAAHLASYTQLTLEQKVDAARRDIPTGYLDEALAANVPYFMIQDAHPIAGVLREFEPVITSPRRGR